MARESATMKLLLIAAAIAGLISVALGAAGDHLSEIIQNTHAFETGLRYNQLYSILLTALLLYASNHNRPLSMPLKICCLTFAAGMLIFCGSLYALSFTGIAFLGYLTPVGGILLMSGWLTLAVYALVAKP